LGKYLSLLIQANKRDFHSHFQFITHKGIFLRLIMTKSNFQPKISIITIVYNGVDLLEATIQSVVNQSYSNIEYLIIDGGSTDGTLELIHQYEQSLSKWISESDKGLYDAMNKGLTTQKLPTQLNWKSLNKGMVVCHQGFLPKRSLAPSYMLDNLSADIDWVIQCLKKAKVITNTNLVVAEYLMGGVSKKRHKQSLKDRYAILAKHYGYLPNLWNHGLIVLRAFWMKVSSGGKNY